MTEITFNQSPADAAVKVLIATKEEALNYGVAGGIVGAAPVVEVRKGAEICIGVGRFQNGGKCLLLNAGQLSFLGGGKVRRRGRIRLPQILRQKALPPE